MLYFLINTRTSNTLDIQKNLPQLDEFHFLAFDTPSTIAGSDMQIFGRGFNLLPRTSRIFCPKIAIFS